MTKRLLILGLFTFILSIASSHAQTVQCQTASGAWGPCPFTQPVLEAQAVNNKVSGGAGTTITNAFGANTTAGNSILCMGFESAAAVPVFTDAQSNTYVVASSSATAPGYTVALATNIVGGTTDTITLTTTSGAASFSCHELKGTVTVGQAWDYVNAQQATSATLNFAQQTANVPNEMAFVAVGMGAGTVNATPSIAGVPSTLTTVDQSNVAVTGGAALAVFYAAHANVNSLPTFTQSISLSASETYSAVLVSVRPVALNTSVVPDPCNYTPGLTALINLTAGGTIINGTAGKQTYICSIDVVTATAQNIALVEGTGTVCATGIAGMAGGTTAATGWNFGANGGIARGTGGFWVYRTATIGDNVCLLLSSTGQTSGGIRYVQQ